MPLIVRLAGTNVEEGSRILDESGLALIARRRPGRRRPPRRTRPATRRAGAGARHERVRRPRLPSADPRLHGSARHLPCRGGDRARDARRGRRHPRQGRDETPRPAGVRQRRGRGPRDRGQRDRDLRAPAGRRRLAARGDRGRDRGRRDHRRRRAGPGHGADEALPDGARRRSSAPTPPAIITPGECKVGIMPSHIYSRVGSASSRGAGR